MFMTFWTAGYWDCTDKCIKLYESGNSITNKIIINLNKIISVFENNGGIVINYGCEDVICLAQSLDSFYEMIPPQMRYT